jgi:MtN3 and saliva related transmembrane protein
MLWNIVGFLGIVFTAIQLLPQIIKALKTRKVQDVSIGLALIVMINAIIWIAYGLHLSDYAIVTANIFNLICAVTLLILKLKANN